MMKKIVCLTSVLLLGDVTAAESINLTLKPEVNQTSLPVVFKFDTASTKVRKFKCTLKSSSGDFAKVVNCSSPMTYSNLRNNSYYFQVDGVAAKGKVIATNYHSFVLNSSSTRPTPVTPDPVTPDPVKPDPIKKTDPVKPTPIVAIPIIDSLTASKTAITEGESVTLSFSAYNATSMALTSVGDVVGKTSSVVTPTANTTYTLTATNSAGSVQKQVTISVTPKVVVVTPTPLSPLSALSNPVTKALTGSSKTYNVGPGQAYPNPDTVPWGALVAGDVVNIFYSSTPYKYKICLRAKGTKDMPVIINGVTDANGNRPKFDFNGAKTASGCNPGGSNNIFNTASAYSLEDYGGIIVKAGMNDPYLYKPQHIIIKNLEIGGAAAGNTFTALNGSTKTYGDAAGIWVQPSADITIENNVIYDNAFGIFTMAKNDILGEACERIVARSNRVYGNGRKDNYYDHNFYIQSTDPLIEGNYIGQTRDGSLGSSYKSRSSGEIFRYNFVEASARAIDLVYAEDQKSGIQSKANYGTDYVYGNVILNDCSGKCAGNPIHLGGDNLGEQENVSTVFNPGSAYRNRLFFYNNTVINKSNSNQSYRVNLFDLSLVQSTVYAWNNIFHNEGSAEFYLTEFAGKVDFVGPNLFSGADVIDTRSTIAANVSILNKQNMIKGNAQFTDLASRNFRLMASSAAIDKGTNIPDAVLNNTFFDKSYGVVPTFSPEIKANGLVSRPLNGSIDFGAFEK